MSRDVEKNTKRQIFWGLLAILLGISIGSLVYNIGSDKINALQATVLKTLLPIELNKTSYEYGYFTKNEKLKPKVGALAFVVGDLDTGELILAKNIDRKLPIASVSKLMTAVISSDMAEENKGGTVKISKQALNTEGRNGNFVLNEKIKEGDILYPLLLESSNDAAEAIALHFTRDTFLQKMNEKAAELGLTNTSFEDPSGLSPLNQSTSVDLFKLAQYMKETKSGLLEITKSKSFKAGFHTWFNNNQFLSDEGYEGGKSGYTDKALQTGVALFNLPLGKDMNRSIGITLLGSKDRRKDIGNIVAYLKKNIYYGQSSDAKADWVKNITNLFEPEKDFVHFTFGGDIMLDRGVKNSIIKNFKGDYAALFEKLKFLKDSDVFFANLEGTASDKGVDRHNLYSFHMDPAVIGALAGAGVDILSVANNHVGDWGRLAYTDTLARLKENEILYTGGGMSDTEAKTPAIIEKYGMKIGFLAFSDKGPDYMEAGTDTAGLLLANDPDFDTIIQNAAKQVDYLVISFHFGEEYETKHDKRQESLAHRAVDAGAKLVIGAHPHVPQDTEVYSRKDCTQSSCLGFIAYSLGNFIFDQSWSKPTMQGMLLDVKLYRDGNMTVRKDTIQLNNVFQPSTIIKGREEKIKFQEVRK